MADPQTELAGTTHTYMARVWYRDTATLFLLGSFVWFVIQDKSTVELLIPHQYHELVAKIVLIVALWIRFQSSTRPVALTAGTTREVHSIDPKGTAGTITTGYVSDSTRNKL